MAKQDFGVGLLQGLYNAGVGNPEVQREENKLKLANAFKQAQLQQEAAEKGLVPTQTASPDTFKKGSPVWALFKKALFPGYSDYFNIPSSFQPDPTQPQIYSDAEGKVNTTGPGDPIPTGGIRFPTRQAGLSALTSQAGRRERAKDYRNQLIRGVTTEDGLPMYFDPKEGFNYYLDSNTGERKQYFGSIVPMAQNPTAGTEHELREVIRQRSIGNKVLSLLSPDKVGILDKTYKTIGNYFEESTDVEAEKFKTLASMADTIVRNNYYGATLTDNEQKAFQDIAYNRSLSPSAFRARISTSISSLDDLEESIRAASSLSRRPFADEKNRKKPEDNNQITSFDKSVGETPEQRKQRLIQELQGAR